MSSFDFTLYNYSPQTATQIRKQGTNQHHKNTNSSKNSHRLEDINLISLQLIICIWL